MSDYCSDYKKAKLAGEKDGLKEEFKSYLKQNASKLLQEADKSEKDFDDAETKLSRNQGDQKIEAKFKAARKKLEQDSKKAASVLQQYCKIADARSGLLKKQGMTEEAKVWTKFDHALGPILHSMIENGTARMRQYGPVR
jgi:hypothetical protein